MFNIIETLQNYFTCELCCIPFIWWTRDHETVITSSRIGNGTNIFPRSSISSSRRHRSLCLHWIMFAMKEILILFSLFYGYIY